MIKKPHVVIVGNGFGGVYTARHLKSSVRAGEIDLTIIGRLNHFLFTPLLHEVATGGLDDTSVVEPLHEVFRDAGIHVMQNEVKKIDTAAGIVECVGTSVPFDYLVIAAGAETTFYNIPGVAEHVLTLKTLADAVKIRNTIIDTVEKASKETSIVARQKLLSFAVVGGGPTGVELVTELQEFIIEIIEKYYSDIISDDDVVVSLINAGPDLIPQFSPVLRARARAILEKKGIKVLLSTAVCGVDAEGLLINKDTRHPAHTVLWVAGVKPYTIEMTEKPELHASGRIVTNQYLQISGQEKIFAVGDIALPKLASDKPVPMLAQVAENEAGVAADNITAHIQGKPLRAFSLSLKGMLVSLGRWQALGEIYGVQLSGPVMWWVWRTVYLFKFLSWRKRLKIVTEWTLNIFSPRDITRLS